MLHVVFFGWCGHVGRKMDHDMFYIDILVFFIFFGGVSHSGLKTWLISDAKTKEAGANLDTFFL